MKNNIDVFYFSCLIPLNVLFVEDGKMGECFFLGLWRASFSQPVLAAPSWVPLSHG